MPNSIARRAIRSLLLSTAFAVAIGLAGATLSFTAHAADANGEPSGPPQQITASFSEHDQFIERLRRQGVSAAEAHSIDKAIRAALTPAQRKAGALIQLSFGGEGWPWTLQSISIEPLQGSTMQFDRAKVIADATPLTAAPAADKAPAAAPKPVAAAKPAAPPPADGTSAPMQPPVQAPVMAPVLAKVQPASLQPAKPAAPTISDGKALALIDPFALDNSSTTRLLPANGAIDPEWPIQPPKPQAVAPGRQTLSVVHGKLTTDVRSSLLNAGVPERIAVEIAQAVSLHPPLRDVPLTGSRFDVAFQLAPDPSVGFILADFTVNGDHQRIWRYRPEGGVPGFYTDDGKRIGGLTMQSPVPNAPIVSPYGMRKHPVLHVNKMHWGVDYQANTGTPILAAADGTVEDVRRMGNYGLYIRLSHDEGVETTYGHLSRFEKGIKAGDTVKAGDVIGYAGSSGLASGPHLYFEVFVDGKRVNPVPLVSDEPLRLGETDLAIFESLKRQTTAVQTASQNQ